MTLRIDPSRTTGMGSSSLFRSLRADDTEALAVLMLESYRGTVDDGGETIAEARQEVQRLFAGAFGELDQQASLVLADGPALACATVVTRDRVAPAPLRPGEAFLAFSMTSPSHQRRGLARAGLERAIGVLASRGEPRLHLVVTRTNEPAVRLYRSFGFQPGPLGDLA